jgi:hypothetical protein
VNTTRAALTVGAVRSTVIELSVVNALLRFKCDERTL